MRISTKRFGMAVAILGLMVCAAERADATQITYTDQGTISGSLGASAFTNALVTVSFTGDTANVTGGLGFWSNSVGTATVTVAGVGTATFTDSMFAFDNQSARFAGIASQAGSVLDTDTSPLFDTYDLKTAIGPVTGAVFFRPDLTYGTTLGSLHFASVTGDTTFTATTGVAAVPEPSTILGASVAVLLGSFYSLRRRKQVSV
jgi:hypothetical protein